MDCVHCIQLLRMRFIGRLSWKLALFQVGKMWGISWWAYCLSGSEGGLCSEELLRYVLINMYAFFIWIISVQT
jgi:hypothetical protein